MKYKWYIKVVLQNGSQIYGIYESASRKSSDAAVELMNVENSAFSAILGEDGFTQIFFRIADVSSIMIGTKSLRGTYDED